MHIDCKDHALARNTHRENELYDSRFAVCYVTLHLVNVDLADNLVVRSPIHVDVHDVVRDGLRLESDQHRDAFSVTART